MKKYLGWTWPEWKRILQHSPVGIIAPPLALTHEQFGGWFCVGFIGLFLAYQAIQEYNKRGNSHVDIAGAIGGLPIGTVIVYLVQTFGG